MGYAHPANQALRKSKMSCTVTVPELLKSALVKPANQSLRKSKMSCTVTAPELLKSAKHVSMHKTDTLNYFVVTEGELWALSEGKDALLKAGDCLVQKGCMHGWENRSEQRVVLVCVLIDSKPAT